MIVLVVISFNNSNIFLEFVVLFLAFYVPSLLSFWEEKLPINIKKVGGAPPLLDRNHPVDASHVWKCPVCAVDVLSNLCGIIQKSDWDVPDVPGLAPQTFPGTLLRHTDHKISFLCSLGIGFASPSGPSPLSSLLWRVPFLFFLKFSFIKTPSSSFSSKYYQFPLSFLLEHLFIFLSTFNMFVFVFFYFCFQNTPCNKKTEQTWASNTTTTTTTWTTTKSEINKLQKGRSRKQKKNNNNKLERQLN